LAGARSTVDLTWISLRDLCRYLLRRIG